MDLIWSSLAWPGTEHVRWTEDGRLHADSLAVHGLAEGPVRVSYQLDADLDGRTRHVEVEVTGRERLVLASDGAGSWTDHEDKPISALSGCLDVDIATTPLTNTLPIRRLRLAPGDSAELLVTYVDMPSLRVRAVVQRYTRLDKTGYRYESGSFRADLTVDERGFVIDYPELWRRLS